MSTISNEVIDGEVIITFTECNKAVDPNSLTPNFWSIVGYPILYGHWNGEKEHSYMYLSSWEELANFNIQQRQFREHHRFGKSLKLTVEQNGWNSYKIVKIGQTSRLCTTE